MIIRLKRFSAPPTSKEEIRKRIEQKKKLQEDRDTVNQYKNNYSQVDSNIANTTTNLGKVGLAGTALLAGGSLVEGARAGKGVVEVGKDLGELAKLRNDPTVRAEIKKLIQAGGDRVDNKLGGVVKLGLGDKAVDLVKKGEGFYNNTKFSTIDRAQKYWGFLNKGADLNRTILNNAGDWSEQGLNELKTKLGPEISDKTKQVIDKLPGSVRKTADSLTHFKNARALGRGALALGGVAGVAYYHGKSLQDYRTNARNGGRS